MSWLEGHVYLPFLVVDPIGLHEFRQNPDLHPTFKIFPLGSPPRKGRRQHPSRRRILSGDPAYSSAQIPDLPDDIEYLDCHTPLLEVLDVSITSPHAPVLDSPLFNGDLLYQ